MNYLVTGGAGFIGSHLVEKLLEDDHHVWVVDDLSSGRRGNLPTASEGENLHFFELNLEDIAELGDEFSDIDVVFHLAALADIVPSIERPMDYFRANVEGTAAVLETARNLGIRKFIYTASASCYGIPETIPTPEQAPIRLEYPYALTKYLGEEMALHWAHVYQLPVISLRLFNVYGPRSRTTGSYGAVFGVFLKQKLEGEPFTVVGDGNQRRDFTYVSDVVSAYLAAADSEIVGEVFNVGSGRSYSVNELVECLGGEVVYIPRRPGEPEATFADISKITTALDWEPEITLQQGVARLLEGIENWRDAPLWTPEGIKIATESWFRYLSDGSENET